MKDDAKINNDARYQALVYLINKIVGRKKLRQCDYVRNSRLLYMLLLEYASCCENLKIPDNSPIAKLDFTRYEKGPGEDFYYENHDMIYRDIKSGRIPQFEQTEVPRGASPRPAPSSRLRTGADQGNPTV